MNITVNEFVNGLLNDAGTRESKIHFQFYIVKSDEPFFKTGKKKAEVIATLDSCYKPSYYLKEELAQAEVRNYWIIDNEIYLLIE